MESEEHRFLTDRMVVGLWGLMNRRDAHLRTRWQLRLPGKFRCLPELALGSQAVVDESNESQDHGPSVSVKPLRRAS